jgi:hypothetical protein
MNTMRVMLAFATLAGALVFAPSHSHAENGEQLATAEHEAGLHDFDFLVGDWRVRHRRLKQRLAHSQEWIEFDGTLSNRALMQGWANVGDNFFDMPGGAYRGVGFRAYDPNAKQWASWWLDGRTPFGDLDPPAKGRFENGIGTFYADSTFEGQPIRVRVIWSHITRTSARWEQSFSPDGGKTWEINWTSDFERIR